MVERLLCPVGSLQHLQLTPQGLNHAVRASTMSDAACTKEVYPAHIPVAPLPRSLVRRICAFSQAFHAGSTRWGSTITSSLANAALLAGNSGAPTYHGLLFTCLLAIGIAGMSSFGPRLLYSRHKKSRKKRADAPRIVSIAKTELATTLRLESGMEQSLSIL